MIGDVKVVVVRTRGECWRQVWDSSLLGLFRPRPPPCHSWVRQTLAAGHTSLTQPLSPYHDEEEADHDHDGDEEEEEEEEVNAETSDNDS